MKKLPIGIENYKEVVDECYYVDKTLLIKEIIDLPVSTAILFTRPRRFGKSLNLSMLQTYFEAGEDNRAFFDNMKIMGCGQRYTDEMGKYPVIRLVLKNIIGNSWEVIQAKLKDLISKEYGRHREILKSGKLSLADTTYYLAIEEQSADIIQYSSALQKLSYYLYMSTGKKTMILLDEYDAPLEEGRQNGFYDTAVSFFRSFYGEALKGNDALRVAVVGGVMQIAKESLFSGLNNLIVGNITASGYGEYFGFTREETEEILRYYHRDADIKQIESWYGGYYFGGTEVYNPWSILLFAQSGILQPYWTSTGKNSLIGDLLVKAPAESLESLNKLLNEEDQFCRINTSIDYREIIPSRDILYSFLAASGYLSAYRRIDGLVFKVRIPNTEISEIFSTEIKSRYVPQSADSEYYSLKEAFLSGNADKLTSALQKYLLSTFSYYEFSDEKNYQVMVLSISALLFDNHVVKSEVNAGNGRCDIMISPKNEKEMGAVIEIKHYKNRASANRFRQDSERALQQILEKDYVEELRARNACPIIAYGIVFYKNKAFVSSKMIIE